ncbi:hypothetical protein AGDE_00265 [Angomonas deanei]|uniref:MORN repeat, putative n=1 Tax=Angomonas deanei TaxID=59799 RepID=A0A7G2C6T9_9TRYP|nr:hypothetical protein AGDE_00265 [Angomonas deanei]CAD2215309.1 MORN repeat, putative [Angomonas deanei]|eukprot:EPY43656.1 hypothetical protein AGDE_00265 [Angomonas deanei]
MLPDGRVFSGSFDPQKGFPLPDSKLEEEGDLYRGEFNDKWQRSGKGEAWLTDGTHYKGIFRDDELVEGTVRIPNGTSEIVFTGTLKDEQFVKGVLKEHDFTYEGEYESNQPHGKGKLTFSTGAEQEGTFFAGKLHGKNCKMKLDGGFVYVGEFLDGNIRQGTLYAPTYTYEGEFNENGRAHGEGTQTYLTNEPRLIFTGIWNNGAMVRGTCVDEYGTPVDWQENHKLQAKVFGDSSGDGEASVAMNSYCGAKLKEADTLFKEMNKSYVDDAERVASETGRYPSRMDLGYEGGMQSEKEALHSSQAKQTEDMQKYKEDAKHHGAAFEDMSSRLKEGISGEINDNMAKINFTRQQGAQSLSAQRVDEQFERFLKTFDRPSSSPPTDLNIDSNAPWKSFTHSK